MERITKKGGEGHSELGANFTVSQALKTGGALTQMETAVDIKVDKFRSGTSLKTSTTFVTSTVYDKTFIILWVCMLIC